MRANRVQVMALAIAIGFAMLGAAHAESGAALTREAQAAITPGKALEMLKQGNQRFVSGKL